MPSFLTRLMSMRKKRKKKEEVYEEKIVPIEADLTCFGLEDITIDVPEDSKDVAKYCIPLIATHFCGQTCSSDKKNGEEKQTTDVLNLGVCLKLLDKFLRQFEKGRISEFTGKEDDYKELLRLIARKRCRDDNALDTIDVCLQRLMNDSERFVRIYHERGEKSEKLDHKEYWGSRQQLLAGKVIADWVDRQNGSLDPIFGVLLQPTAGRVGPGDTGLIHDLLFDDNKHMAYHSAVHDAFGYLMTKHCVGPGYDYVHGSTFFDTSNCLAGQTPGISFWKQTIQDIETKQKVLKIWKC